MTELVQRYGKGVLICGVLLLAAGIWIPVLWWDTRVWIVFVLGVALVGTHPRMQFTAMGMDQRPAADRCSLLFINLGAYFSFLPMYAHYLSSLHRSGVLAPWTWLTWAAALLAIIGIVIRVWAIQALGRWFTAAVITTSDQELIQTGLYSLLRHPSYTGAMLFWAVQPLLFGLPQWILWAWPIILAAWLWRIQVEEKALLERFGDTYRAYQKKAKRLIPWVY